MLTTENKILKHLKECTNNKSFLHIGLLLLICLNMFLCFATYRAANKAEQAKYVYVYSSEALAKKYPELVALKQKYDADLQALTGQVNDVREKLGAMKDKKTKAEASEAYFESLTQKRNNLVSAYEQNLMFISNKIHDAISKVAAEKGLPTVVEVKLLSVKTDYVVDITEDILKKL